MRFVVATVARPSGGTGVQTHFNAFLGYLRDRGQDSLLVTPYSYNTAVVLPTFAVRSVLGWANASLSVWWYEMWHRTYLKRALRRALRGAGPLVVYAQCPRSAWAALEARDGPHQRVVMAAHFNASLAEDWVALAGLRRGGRVYRWLQATDARVLPRLDGIVYVSEYARRSLEGILPAVRAVRHVVLPNFVPALDERPANRMRNDLIGIGTLEPRKNQGYLLRVLAAAKDRGKRYGLTLVGDGASREEFERLARSLGVSEQVRFLGAQPEARRYLAGHRVLVHAALMENLPVVLIEALAAGLPLCAGPVGGIPEVFEDGREGLYWSLDDAAADARKLIALLDDAETYERMSAAARATFESKFESSRVAGRLLAFLSDS